MRLSVSSFLAATVFAACSSWQANGEKVVISYQSQMGGVVHFIARDKGFYGEQGIEPEMVWYPSGAPQVKDAVEKKSWDVGEAGVVPNIIGGPQGILGIAISQDQSATNQLVGNAEGVAIWPPESMEGHPIVLSPNSTGDFVVQACLKSAGFNIEDVEFIYEQQAGCLEAMTPKEGSNGTRANLGGLWAPNTYTFADEVEGAETLCSGASVYATVTGGFMARKEWAEANPKLLAKLMAAWLRAIEFTNNPDNKDEVLDRMADFYKEHEVDISSAALEQDLKLVGLFGLQKQLEFMERKGEPPASTYDIWTTEVGNFMLDNGVISELIPPSTYIDDTYMRMVNDDPELKAYALGQEVGAGEEDSSANAPFVASALAVVAAGALAMI